MSGNAATLREFGTNALIDELASRGDLALAVAAYQRSYGAPDQDAPRVSELPADERTGNAARNRADLSAVELAEMFAPVFDDLEHELRGAFWKFAAFNSPHEGWAVIREELDELWEHVRANEGRTADAHVEALQIAAMALRYILDLCPRSSP